MAEETYSVPVPGVEGIAAPVQVEGVGEGGEREREGWRGSADEQRAGGDAGSGVVGGLPADLGSGGYGGGHSHGGMQQSVSRRDGDWVRVQEHCKAGLAPVPRLCCA